MKRTLKITKAELQTLFYSPVAWMILIIFMIQVCLNFFDIFTPHVVSAEEGYSTYRISLNLFSGRYGLLTALQSQLYFYIPLLTMGLISREYSTGSIKLLYSAPLTNKQIVWGKYLAIATFGAVMLCVLLILFILCSLTIVNFDAPAILSGMLGILLLMLAYMAIGLFISSLTQYQVVAAIGTITIFALLSMVGDMWQDVQFVRDLTWWLSIKGRASEMVNGLICSEDVLYFIILIVLFVNLTIMRLNNVRQKTPKDKSLARYFALVFAAFAVGYISTNPYLMFFYDATETKECTLSEGSQAVMKQLKGKVTLTTYVNTIGRYNYTLTPTGINSDLERYKQFRRFSPQIKIKHVFFYDTPESTRYEQLFDIWPEEKTIHDFARRMGQIYKIDSNITLRPMEIQKIVDLTPEYNRQVTHIVHESGKSTFLRVFDDLYVKPNEQEIAAAFKRIVSELQKVAFIEGNGERSIYNTSDQHYEYFSSDKRFRSSLINQGFDVYTHNLEQPIPENISIVVIADPREMLDEVEMKHLRAFIARGGNMLITGEPRRNEIMNSIIGEFGVEALPGVVVRDSKMIQADQILARVTKSAGDIFHKVKTMHSREINVIMPGVAALKCNEDKGFKVKPLLTSDTDSTWIERQTVDFVDDTARFNPEKGDIPGTFPLALSLSRKVNEKEQRIVIMSDADCLCNGEIFRRRTGQKIANNNFLEGIFYYLSGDEVPINMYRPLPTDYTVKIRTAGLGIVKIFIMWIIPALLAVAGIVIWIRRRGR